MAKQQTFHGVPVVYTDDDLVPPDLPSAFRSVLGLTTSIYHRDPAMGRVHRALIEMQHRDEGYWKIRDGMGFIILTNGLGVTPVNREMAYTWSQLHSQWPMPLSVES